MSTIVLASRNEHKIEELRAVLGALGITLKSALEFPELKEVVEDAPTLEGNALKKAQYVHRATGLPALADDTGLEVDVLNGRPGVFSARYAGEDATYQDNVDKLLRELEGMDEIARGARFRTVIAFVSDDATHTFEGICRGNILKSGRGSGGFGYDPIFRPEGYDETFAELSQDEKNKISHRGRATEQFIEYLKKAAV